MTFAEYLKYEAPAGFRDELIHGEVVLSPSAKAKHQEICQRLERLLYKAVLRSFVVQRDTTLYVGGKEGPRPDVFVLRKDRWKQACDSELGYPEGVPEMVIEVRSSSNSESELEEAKRSIYCTDPRGLAYWTVNPEAKTVTAFTADSKQIVSIGSVSLPTEIGGGFIPLAKIFG
jgi:Uma2 family endonuclease